MTLAVCLLALVAVAGGTSDPPAPRAPLYSRVAATAVARELLAAMPLPPGARRRAGPPAVLAARLGRPANSEDHAKVVDRHEYWIATERPFGMLAFLARHGPARRVVSSGYGGVRGRTTEWSETLEAPVADPLAGLREVFVAIVRAAGRGRYAVRVDAVVAWHRRRPARSLVPATARRLTVQTRLAPARRGQVPRTRSLTSSSPATVRAVARAVDSLSLAEPAGPPPSCPAMGIGSGARAPRITLTFRGGRSARILAQVRTSGAFVCARTGEAVAWITVEGGPEVALTDHLDTVIEVRGSSLIERLEDALGHRLPLT
ncbi:MAG TPA: hypothetical protein VGL57_08410 [Solirubrobacteraceae bacterium]